MARKIIIISLFWVASINCALATTYYVKNAGSNDSTGLTESAAWQTCGYMMTQISGGDIVLFMGGTYAENNSGRNSMPTTLFITVSGSYNNHTTFKAAPGYPMPVFTGYGATGYDASCYEKQAITKYDDVHHITLDSLYVKWSFRGIELTNGDSIFVKNSVVCSTGNGSEGVNNGGIIFPDASGPHDYILIEGNTLFHNREVPGVATPNQAAILTYNFNYSTITNNIIFDQPYGHGAIFLKGGVNDYNEISYNTIYGAAIGINLYYNCRHNDIHHNVIYDQANSEGWGIDVHGTHYAGQNNDHNKVYNNTIFNIKNAIGWGAGASEIEQMDSCQFWNNICYAATYPFAKSVNANVSNYYIDYNCYYVDGSSTVAYWDGSTYTLAGMRSTWDVDTNSVHADPVFADPANHDFHLTANSPASVVSGGRGGAYLSYMGAYDPNVATHTISGTITLNGGGGLSGVTVSGFPGNPQTDNSGYYSATVPDDWSGTATPVLTGYTFVPPSRTYSGVNSDVLNQDYTASVLATHTISGTITSGVGGGGLSGVTLSGLPGSPQTDNNGDYSATISYGWSGIVTPVLTCYIFVPDTIQYSGVNSDISNQNYVAWPDLLSPISSNVEVTYITDRSARITWTTDELSTSQVEYGLTISYDSITTLDTTLTLAHSVDLDGLIADTLYHFQARSIDGCGNEGISGDFTFHTLVEDTTRPVIDSIKVSNITSHSAVISWITNELASSQVDYGYTQAYGDSSYLNTLVLNHNVTITDFQADTLYHFRVRSSDASGNEAISGDSTFHTDTSSIAEWDNISVGCSTDVSGTYLYYSTVAINDSVINPRGGTSSTWASDDTSSIHWVNFDLSGAALVAGMVVRWAWNDFSSSWMCSQQYRIQYWDDDMGAFIDIDTVNNSFADSVTATWFDTTITTDSIRYYQPANMGPPTYPTIVWLTELEIYGVAGIPAPEPIGTVVLGDTGAMVFANPVNVQLPVFYEFALDVDSTYPNPRIEPPLIIDTVISTTFNGLSSEYTYYWKCRAIASDRSDTSSWSWSEVFILNSTDTQNYSYAFPDSNKEVNSRYFEFNIIFDSAPNFVFIEIDSSSDFSTSFNTISTNISLNTASWEPTSVQDSTNIFNILRNNGRYYWRASTDGISWITIPFKLKLAAHAYPVPFRKSKSHSQITFTNLQENSKIIIASVSGTIIFTQSGVGPGDWIWDVKNSNGRDIASGVYLYAVDSKAGASQGKIVVIR